jgi:hypothetical protein
VREGYRNNPSKTAILLLSDKVVIAMRIFYPFERRMFVPLGLLFLFIVFHDAGDGIDSPSMPAQKMTNGTHRTQCTT